MHEVALPEITEQRIALRVAAGRPGRVYSAGDGDSSFFPCSVVDISESGCRILVKRSDIPQKKSVQVGSVLNARVSLGNGGDVDVDAEVMWSQVQRGDFLVVGARFCDVACDSVGMIQDFVLTRLHAGLNLTDIGKAVEEDVSESLRIPLEAEGVSKVVADAMPYRFLIGAVGKRTIPVKYAPKVGEKLRVPLKGELLNISVFPPQWARGEGRTISFAARVVDVDSEGAKLEYHAGDNNLYFMIKSVIPPKIIREEKPFEIDIKVVFIIIAVIIIALIISSGR